MPTLRPSPPPVDLRCTHSNGRIRCRHPKIRGEPFCRSHLQRNRNIHKRPKSKKIPSNSPEKKRKLTKNSPPTNDSEEIPPRDSPAAESDVIDPPSPEIPQKSRHIPSNNSEIPEPIVENLRRFSESKTPKPGQLWALRHESDGLPRSYARIDLLHPVKSTVDITQLDFHPISPLEFRFVENKLPMSCGTFRAQNSSISKDISALCHKIGWEKDARVSELKSFYRIYPKKSQVWAVYREHSEGEDERRLFKLVEVVEGFSEESGLVGVLELEGVGVSEGEVKVKRGCGAVRRFSVAELVLFSHRVPVLEEEFFGKW